MTREELAKTLESVIEERTAEVCSTIRAVAGATLESRASLLGGGEDNRKTCLEHERRMREYLRRVRRSRAKLEDALEYCLTYESASVGAVVRYLSMR